MDLRAYFLLQIKNHNISIFYFWTNAGLNLSGAGLATANPIAPFHCWFILEDYARSKDPVGFHWNTIVEVKWCRELTIGKQGHYGIGVKYPLNWHANYFSHGSIGVKAGDHLFGQNTVYCFS